MFKQKDFSGNFFKFESNAWKEEKKRFLAFYGVLAFFFILLIVMGNLKLALGFLIFIGVPVSLLFLIDKLLWKHRRKGFIVRTHLEQDAWNADKDGLLETHYGWFAAYLNGERVALEKTLDDLVSALEKKLGKPRPTCFFVEIIPDEQKGHRRGPSPRTKKPS